LAGGDQSSRVASVAIGYEHAGNQTMVVHHPVLWHWAPASVSAHPIVFVVAVVVITAALLVRKLMGAKAAAAPAAKPAAPAVNTQPNIHFVFNEGSASETPGLGFFAHYRVPGSSRWTTVKLRYGLVPGQGALYAASVAVPAGLSNL